MSYRKANILCGWASFFIALTTYTLTVEPTASFWDCAEFVATSYKLEVPHPPGAPLFLLIGRAFSMLADSPDRVAFWVNMVSVLSSAFAILFLFWIITHLVRKIIDPEKSRKDLPSLLTIMGAGFVGSLVFTFSDSFWFSAVESEVYAMSLFFTSFVFWCIFRWESIDGANHSLENKWLILIAYAVGLSVGVHLLNLLTIPTIAIIAYYKRRKVVRKRGLMGVLAAAFVVIIFVMEGIIPGLPATINVLEIFFVNSLGLPFGSGLIVFLVLFFGFLILLNVYSYSRKLVGLNTAVLAFTFFIIGYSSYLLIPIRSAYDPPIDQSDPEEVISFISYLNREQYGNRPLLFGPKFTSRAVDQVMGSPIYMKGEDRYLVKEYRIETKFDPSDMTLFPRMYSTSPDGSHERQYRRYVNLREGESPNFLDNLQFMWNYQIGVMYLRYFFWNFIGRESDDQLADWVGIPDRSAPREIRENKARNIYFGLPFLLGLLGMWFQYEKNPRYFFPLILLFFLMGLGIVLYLNVPPMEPRERDYIYTGSYFIFSIWAGIGLLAIRKILIDLFKPRSRPATIALVVVSFLIALCAPLLMAKENWDDHDRSSRYFSVVAAKNYLDSCAPNSILFTGGDNDTFPLWFAQEVLGYRTDVRVIVLSYLNTDWYIEQMTRDAYESKALSFGLNPSCYRQGGLNDYLPYFGDKSEGDIISLKVLLKMINEEDPRLQIQSAFTRYNLLPAGRMYLDIDLEDVMCKDSLWVGDPELKDFAVDRMNIDVLDNGIEKKDLVILDLITKTNWSRPLYFNHTSLSGLQIDLRDYAVQEGLAYRLLPVRREDSLDLVNTEIMYHNLMNKFGYDGLDDPDIYYDQDYRGFSLMHRSAFNSLAEALILKGDSLRAKEVLFRCLELIPDISIPYDLFSLQQVDLLLTLGEVDRALEISTTMVFRAEQWLKYCLDNLETREPDHKEFQKRLLIINEIIRALRAAGLDDYALTFEEVLENLIPL